MLELGRFQLIRILLLSMGTNKVVSQENVSMVVPGTQHGWKTLILVLEQHHY